MNDTNLSGVRIQQPFLRTFLDLLLRVILNQSKLFDRYRKKGTKLRRVGEYGLRSFLARLHIHQPFLTHYYRTKINSEQDQIDLAFADDK